MLDISQGSSDNDGADRVAPEKPVFLTGLPHNFIRTVTGDRSMFKVISLSRGQLTIVDESDYDLLVQHRWWLSGKKGKEYVYGRIDGRLEYMHRVIMQPPDGVMVDHVNRNRLDNRRCNLRLCTRSQNLQNQGIRRTVNKTSRYKGVKRHSSGRGWQVSIQNRYIGLFQDECMASRAYDHYAKKLFGSFARTNLREVTCAAIPG